MTSNSPDPKVPRPGGLLARLRGMVQSLKAQDAASEDADADDAEDMLEFDANVPQAAPLAGEEAPEAPAAEVDDSAPMAELLPPVTMPQNCPLCQSPRKGDQSYCEDCGYVFPPPGAEPVPTAAVPSERIKGRYELGQQLSERGGIFRYRGTDHGADLSDPQPVILVRTVSAAPEKPAPPAKKKSSQFELEEDDEVLPTFEDPRPSAQPATEPMAPRPAWPSLGWECHVLDAAPHPSLPRVLDHFVEDGYEYLVAELPVGQSLWDAWDAPDATAEQRYSYLKQIAEALHHLHLAGAMLEGLRPDMVTVLPSGQTRLNDLGDLLPLPLPPDAPIRATLYTAPELAAASSQVDARADLYSFGAMLYSLHVGRELTEMDFERPGSPKPFIPYFPDIHPAFGRLITKTFCRERDLRFPTDEAAKTDPTGFTELIRTLDVCRRTLDNVRLEIAAWTTTGMVRTGNEDAFALIHSAESRQDDLGESALVFLCDGMGGYEAGEIAAALAIQSLRRSLLQHKSFQTLAGGSAFPTDGQALEGGAPRLPEVEDCKRLLLAALKEANRHVFTASRSGIGRRGMGCTAEAVYVDGRKVVVGHVGDSRTYHLHEGRLIQITRDQTLVARLVELGTLSPEEAEDHPRKNELQQAIGGQPDVEPGLYHGILKPGDWVVVCSDGVSNHVPPDMLQEMLQVEAQSAEMAARRLVNLVNIKGATDNATVVVIRAT